MFEAMPRHVFNKCSVDFPTCFLQMQGAFNPNNLDSDTVRYQINEEVHNWPALNTLLKIPAQGFVG